MYDRIYLRCLCLPIGRECMRNERVYRARAWRCCATRWRSAGTTTRRRASRPRACWSAPPRSEGLRAPRPTPRRCSSTTSRRAADARATCRSFNSSGRPSPPTLATSRTKCHSFNSSGRPSSVFLPHLCHLADEVPFIQL
jgi:hypothetical protein